jgi:toxin ParE1/3/4
VKVRFSDEALGDLRGIGDYIAKDNALRARDFVRELRQRAMELADNPLAYPLLPRHEQSGIRRRVFRNYLIVHILHGAQDYEALLFPEG